MLTGALALLVLALIVPTASAAVFKASIKGTQEVSWSVDGTTSACESRRGTGSGVAKFSFKSPKSAPLFVGSGRKAPKIVGSLTTKATGTQSGSFSETVATACPGFEPGDPYTTPAQGCGATSFGIRVDFKTRGAFVNVTGPSVPLGPVSLANTGCPTSLDAHPMSNDLTACGDGVAQDQRSWGIADAAGEGLLFSKLHISSKKLLKTKKRKSKKITGRAVVDCNVPSLYSGGISYKAELKYTLTLKRQS